MGMEPVHMIKYVYISNVILKTGVRERKSKIQGEWGNEGERRKRAMTRMRREREPQRWGERHTWAEWDHSNLKLTTSSNSSSHFASDFQQGRESWQHSPVISTHRGWEDPAQSETLHEFVKPCAGMSFLDFTILVDDFISLKAPNMRHNLSSSHRRWASNPCRVNATLYPLTYTGN